MTCSPHDGRLINAIGDAPDDTTVAGFVEPRRALVDAGVLTSFEEVETGAVTESFGKVAHRFSTYEKRAYGTVRRSLRAAGSRRRSYARPAAGGSRRWRGATRHEA